MAPVAPVKYSAPLVTYVGALAVLSAAVLAKTWETPRDPLTLGIGCAVIAILGGYSVRPVAKLSTTWSAAIFVHVGVAILFGPLGCFLAALAEGAATTLRFRSDWFRLTFNVSNFFLANVAGWGVFRLLASSQPSFHTALGTLAAGAVQFSVNYALLAIVVRITSGMPVLIFLRRNLEPIPYSLGYGFSAFAFVVLYQTHGTLGFITVLTPVILLQVFLVVLARRVYQHDLETKAHQEARVKLLQQAIDASTDERERIAASIHDGVVQDLVGLSFTLSAKAAMKPENITDEERKKMIDTFTKAAQTVRDATRDLRTLMIDIASPKLKQQGLRAALLDLLQNVPEPTATTLDMADDTNINESMQRLIFRVAQEAVRNCVKYAQAPTITITVATDPSELHLTVHDDGKGFSTTALPERQAAGHVGLALLARTVGDGGGTLDITSQPGVGTTVAMRIPRSEGSED